jgi:hypothetical protein
MVNRFSAAIHRAAYFFFLHHSLASCATLDRYWFFHRFLSGWRSKTPLIAGQEGAIFSAVCGPFSTHAKGELP